MERWPMGRKERGLVALSKSAGPNAVSILVGVMQFYRGFAKVQLSDRKKMQKRSQQTANSVQATEKIRIQWGLARVGRAV